MLLLDVAATSVDVGSTSSRLTKVAHIADLLTRAASDPDSNLGKDVTTQLFSNPRVLGIVGGLLLLMSLVPGLPKARPRLVTPEPEAPVIRIRQLFIGPRKSAARSDIKTSPGLSPRRCAQTSFSCFA